MTATVRHPAAKLPEVERIEYLNTVASMALVDQDLHAQELEKMARLADEIGLPTAIKEQQLGILAAGRTTEVARHALMRFSADADLRSALMMDSIAIAFSDGKLAPSELRQLSTLAAALGLSLAEVVATAQLVERILFSRHEVSEQALARELGEGLAGARTWLRRISGVMAAA